MRGPRPQLPATLIVTTLVVMGAPDRIGDSSSARTPVPTVLREGVDDAVSPIGPPRPDLRVPRRHTIPTSGGPSGPMWKSFG